MKKTRADFSTFLKRNVDKTCGGSYMMPELISSKSITALICASLASAFFCYVIRYIGLKYSIVSKSSYRRDKEQQVPLMGGLGIYLALSVVNLWYNDLVLWKLLLATLPIVIFGIIDDIKEASARFKFSAQSLSAILWVGMISPHEMIYTKLGLNPLVGTLVTCLFLVTLANAYNFLDGVDGQVGLMAMIALLGIGIADEHNMWARSLLMASAILGFIYHNFPPAKIYLGEVGSSFLGFSVGAFATQLPVSTTGWSTFWAINFFCSLAFVDLIRVVYSRLSRGQAPWSADKSHIHHKLSSLGVGRYGILFFAMFISIYSSATGYQLQMRIASHNKLMWACLSAAALCVVYFGVLYFETQLGRKSSLFGRQLITKYIQFDDRVLSEFHAHSALVIDLLPYFSEIQSRGIAAVERFASEFGQIVAQQKNVYSIRMVGSYSVAIIYNSQFREQNIMTWKGEMFTQLQSFFLRHKAVRALMKDPEGVYFYNDLLDPEIAILLEIHPTAEDISLRRRAS